MQQIIIILIITCMFGGYAVFMQHQLELKTQEILSLKFQLQEAALSQKALTQSIFSQVSKIDETTSSVLFTAIVGVCIFVGIVVAFYYILPNLNQIQLDKEYQQVLIDQMREISQSVDLINNTNIPVLTESIQRLANQILELQFEMEKLTPTTISHQNLVVMNSWIETLSQNPMATSLLNIN